MLLKGQTVLGSMSLIVGSPSPRKEAAFFWGKFCFLKGFVWVKTSTRTPDRGFERELGGAVYI